MGRPKKNSYARSDEKDLRESDPGTPSVIEPAIAAPAEALKLPELRMTPQAWRVTKEQLVIIHGGTTYVAVGKVHRDPQIIAKLREQGVEMEPYTE
jgi:hypothetical protein